MTGAALQNRQTRMMIYDILLNFFTYGFLGWCTAHLLVLYAASALLAVLCSLLIVDISVTAAGILKWNRHLDKTEEIAGELRSLSDQIGENKLEKRLQSLEKRIQISHDLRLRSGKTDIFENVFWQHKKTLRGGFFIRYC